MVMIMPIVFFLFFKVWSPLCYKRNLKRMLSFTHHGEAAYLSSVAMCLEHMADNLLLVNYLPTAVSTYYLRFFYI